MASFWTSINISIIFTGVEMLAAVGSTAIVGVLELPVTVAVAGIALLGFVMPIIEDTVKRYYLK